MSSCMKVRNYRHAKLAAKMNVMMREIIGVVGPNIAVKARRLTARERGGIAAINESHSGRVRGVGGGSDDIVITRVSYHGILVFIGEVQKVFNNEMVTTTNGLIRVQRVVFFITCELWAAKPSCPIQFRCFHGLIFWLFLCRLRQIKEGQELRLRARVLWLCKGNGNVNLCCVERQRELLLWWFLMRERGFICVWRGQLKWRTEDFDEDKIKDFGCGGGEEKVKNKW